MNPDIRKGYGKLIPKVTAKLNDVNHAYREIYGLDIRDPTSDIRIVEFCLSLPEDQYLKGGVSRRLIRRAMADKLPMEILNNQQRGLQAADWLESLLASRDKLLLEVAAWSKNDLLSEVLDLQRITRLLRDMPSAQSDAANILQEYRHLLEFGLMMGRFILWFEQGAAVSA
jgi:asparagine synthase (glutamine-hydrolysing)